MQFKGICCWSLCSTPVSAHTLVHKVVTSGIPGVPRDVLIEAIPNGSICSSQIRFFICKKTSCLTYGSTSLVFLLGITMEDTFLIRIFCDDPLVVARIDFSNFGAGVLPVESSCLPGDFVCQTCTILGVLSTHKWWPDSKDHVIANRSSYEDACRCSKVYWGQQAVFPIFKRIVMV